MTTDRHAKQARVQFVEWVGHVSARAILLNIWSDGALVLMEEQPELNQHVWIRLREPVRSDWLEAIPVRYGQFHEVEIRFSHPCPRTFLWAATRAKDFRLVLDSEEETSWITG
jgi:hypothetical protein